MAKIIKFPSYRRLTRASGARFEIKKKQRHKIRLRIYLPPHDRIAVEDMLYGHLFRLIQKLGGFRLTKGFKLNLIRNGKWHRLPRRVRPKHLKDFLLTVDSYCEQGWMEVEVNGVLMARSKTA